MREYSILILPAAKKDIYEARKWYSQYNQELPKRFKEEVKLIAEALKLRPAVHAVRPECKVSAVIYISLCDPLFYK